MYTDFNTGLSWNLEDSEKAYLAVRGIPGKQAPRQVWRWADQHFQYGSDIQWIQHEYVVPLGGLNAVLSYGVGEDIAYRKG